MFARRAPLDLPPSDPRRAPRKAREPKTLRHVFAQGPQCERAVQAVSDRVVLLPGHLAYGSLAGTLGYFGDGEALRRAAQGFEVTMAFAGDFLPGFLESTGHADASRSWRQWHRGILAFLGACGQSASVQGPLAHFCSSMEHLGYGTPEAVPALGREDLRRRFGKVVEGVWHQWRHGDDPSAPLWDWLQPVAGGLPLESLTSDLGELDGYGGTGVPASCAGAVAEALVLRSLGKLRAWNTPNVQYALCGFTLKLGWGQVEQSHQVVLQEPLGECTANTAGLLESAWGRLTQTHQEGEQSWVFHELVRAEVCVSQVRSRSPSRTSLFGDALEEASLDSLRRELPVGVCERIWSPRLPATRGICEVEEGDVLFRFAHQHRPVARLQEPLALDRAALARLLGPFRMVFGERLGEFDYFQARGQALWAWVRVPAGGPSTWTVLGFYGEDGR